MRRINIAEDSGWKKPINRIKYKWGWGKNVSKNKVNIKCFP